MNILWMESDDVFKEFVLEHSHGFEVFFPRVGVDEILDFHLRAFAVAENEVARTNFVSESFALLSETEGEIWVEGVDDVFIVDEDTLGGLGTKIGDGFIG